MASELETIHPDAEPLTHTERITLVTTAERGDRRGDALAGLFFVATILLALWVIAAGASTGAEAPLFSAFDRL